MWPRCCLHPQPPSCAPPRGCSCGCTRRWCRRGSSRPSRWGHTVDCPTSLPPFKLVWSWYFKQFCREKIHLFCMIYILAFSRCFYQKRLSISHQKKETKIYRSSYSKDVHRNKYQAYTIATLTHFLYTTKIARIRRYMMLSTIFKCQDVQHTIGLCLDQELSSFPHEEEQDPADVVESKSAGSGHHGDVLMQHSWLPSTTQRFHTVVDGTTMSLTTNNKSMWGQSLTGKRRSSVLRLSFRWWAVAQLLMSARHSEMHISISLRRQRNSWVSSA